MPETKTDKTVFQSIEWIDNHIHILDQSLLPEHEVYLDIYEVDTLREAIRSLRIRGAPAIGIAAAYGIYLGVKDMSEASVQEFEAELNRVADYLATARPTAVNLQWALDRAKRTSYGLRDRPIAEIKEQLLVLAKTIHEEDKRICADIGRIGQELVPENARIITHCNTGSLATGKYGTALSVIYHAHLQDKNIHVWVDETRPLLQGSRLTSWELLKSKIDHRIIADSMAGWLMKNGKADLVVVGTDRVARNGDTANKIGTYSLAVLAAWHNIPFYVAAPLSSIDMALPSGSEIPIEERDGRELRETGKQMTAPPNAPVYNPAFDVTPAELITAFITEKGIVRPDFSRAFNEITGLKPQASIGSRS